MSRWISKKITRDIHDTFIARQATKERTLDLGSAWTRYAELFPNRVACDIEERTGVDVVADAHDLPFADNEFPVVLCSEVLEHLHTPEKAIAEMWRVTKPGGTLILTTRFMYPQHDVPHDYFRYTEYGMRHLFRRWEIIELIPETKNFETMAVLIHRMAFTMEFRGGQLTRAFLFLLAKLVRKLGWLVKKEYGIRRANGHHIETNTFASGYYIVCKKPV